jgi:uncharacterized protein YkwD
MALAAILLTAPAPAVSALNARRDRADVHVRHQMIHRPAHTKAKPLCSRQKAHKSHRAAKRASSCHKPKSSVRRTHKRMVRRAPKRTAGHRHAVGHQRPATASGYCPNANLTPGPGDIERVAAATLCLVNGERARFGEPGLIEDARLASAASGHSRDMDERDYFEHTSPGGQTLLMRIQASGFIPAGHVGYTLGENIAWGTLWLGTPAAIVKAWMDSPGHRANILDGAYRYSGIGIDPDLPRSMSDGQTGGMYTQDFGTILG